MFPPLPSAIAEEALPEPYFTLLRMMRAGNTLAEIASEIGVRAKALVYRVQLLRDRLPNGSVPPVTRRISTRCSRTSEFAEKIECLRCRREFVSWDKRRNRICGQCKHHPTENSGGMDEHHMHI